MTAEEPAVAIRVWPLEPVVRLPPQVSAPQVDIRADTLAQIKTHAGANLHAEIGGVLIGGVQVEGTAVRLSIMGSLPAEAVDSGPTHMTFTHETWRRIRKQRQVDYPDALIVGWYHSHPGLGVFLSAQDLALHEQIFDQQLWCVALVLDPVNDRRAFFWPSAGGMIRCAKVVIGPDQMGSKGENSDGIFNPED